MTYSRGGKLKKKHADNGDEINYKHGEILKRSFKNLP